MKKRKPYTKENKNHDQKQKLSNLHNSDGQTHAQGGPLETNENMVYEKQVLPSALAYGSHVLFIQDIIPMHSTRLPLVTLFDRAFYIASTSPVVKTSQLTPSEYQPSYESLSPSQLQKEINTAKSVFCSKELLKGIPLPHLQCLCPWSRIQSGICQLTCA
jgi:hypothetical protein